MVTFTSFWIYQRLLVQGSSIAQQPGRYTITEVKILGLKWNTNTDEFCIELPQFDFSKTKVNKRNILSHIATPFDPTGMVSPVFLKGRNLMSRIVADGVKWDEPLKQQHVDDWKEIAQSWINPETGKGYQFKFPRPISRHIRNPRAKFELHAFADASEQGFGTAIYLVTILNGERISSLIFGKSSIIPPKFRKEDGSIKVESMPRCELQAAFNTVKAVRFVVHELQVKLEDIQIWTDNMVVIDWLRSNKSCGVFEDNRLDVIRHFKVAHVLGPWNPADIASREQNPEDVFESIIWSKGPSWLEEDKSIQKKSKEFREYLPEIHLNPETSPFCSAFVYIAAKKNKKEPRRQSGPQKKDFNALGLEYGRFGS